CTPLLLVGQHELSPGHRLATICPNFARGCQLFRCSAGDSRNGIRDSHILRMAPRSGRLPDYGVYERLARTANKKMKTEAGWPKATARNVNESLRRRWRGRIGNAGNRGLAATTPPPSRRGAGRGT